MEDLVEIWCPEFHLVEKVVFILDYIRKDMFVSLNPEFEIFDPRKGVDYTEPTRSGIPFSIRENNFLVLRYRSVNKWFHSPRPEFDEFIRTSMNHTGVQGVYSVSSLSPQIRKVLPVFPETTVEELGGVMGYFPLEPQITNNLLGLRKVVTFEIIIVGSSARPFQTPVQSWKTYPWDIDLFLGEPQNLGCLSRFDGETETLEIFTKIYDGIDQQLEIILKGRQN